MSCKEIKDMIMTQSFEALSTNQRKKVDQHLAWCTTCQSLVADYKLLRESFKKQSAPQLSTKVQSQTLEKCHEILTPLSVRSVINKSVPTWIWIVLSISVSVSIFMFFTLVTDFLDHQKLSVKNVQIFLFFLQNMILLVLSPVLMKYMQKNQMTAKLTFSRIR